MFHQSFSKHVIDGDSITCTVGGFTCVATLHLDFDSGAPDKNQDGFWPSIDPKDPGYIGSTSKAKLKREYTKAARVMQAWENDEWHYFGVAVTVWCADIALTGPFDHALWGVEGNYPGGDNDYLREVANQLLPDALRDARRKIKKLAECAG